jgi:hypothetical protein
MISFFKIFFVLLNLTLASSPDDEIVANLDFAMSLEIIEDIPSSEITDWTEADLLEQDLNSEKSETRSAP